MRDDHLRGVGPVDVRGDRRLIHGGDVRRVGDRHRTGLRVGRRSGSDLLDPVRHPGGEGGRVVGAHRAPGHGAVDLLTELGGDDVEDPGVRRLDEEQAREPRSVLRVRGDDERSGAALAVSEQQDAVGIDAGLRRDEGQRVPDGLHPQLLVAEREHGVRVVRVGAEAGLAGAELVVPQRGDAVRAHHVGEPLVRRGGERRRVAVAVHAAGADDDHDRGNGLRRVDRAAEAGVEGHVAADERHVLVGADGGRRRAARAGRSEADGGRSGARRRGRSAQLDRAEGDERQQDERQRRAGAAPIAPRAAASQHDDEHGCADDEDEHAEQQQGQRVAEPRTGTAVGHGRPPPAPLSVS